MSSALFGEGGGGGIDAGNEEIMLTNGAAAEADEIVAEYLEEHDPMPNVKEENSTKRGGRKSRLPADAEEAEGENVEPVEDGIEEAAEAAVTRSSLRNSSQLPKKRKDVDIKPIVGSKSNEKSYVDDDEQPTSTAREAAKLENHVDENQCRVCTSTDALISLFKSIQKQTIAEKLMILCPTVSIAQKDFMPQFICNPCLDNVNIALQLKSQCETTERELRKKLSRSKNKVRRPTGYVVIDAALDSEPSDFERNDDAEFKVSDGSVAAEDDSEDSDFGSTKKKRPSRAAASKRSKRKSTAAAATPASKVKEKKRAAARPASKRPPPSPVLVKEEEESSDAPAIEEIDEEPIAIKQVKKRKTKSAPSSDNEEGEGGGKQKEYPCDECEQVFTRKLSLTLHKKAHTPREPLKCEICGQVFKIQGAYRKHVQKHSEEPTGFECSKCEYTGPSKAELRRHLVDEHDEQGILHECEKCKRKFVSEARLEKHKEGRCPGLERPQKIRQVEETFTVGKDLFKSVAPLTTTYWSDSFSD